MNKQNKIRRNTKPYKILQYLSLGTGLLIISSLAPASGAKLVQNLIKLYIRNKKFARHHFLRDIKKLQIRKLIKYRELANKEIEITLTKNGQELTLRGRLDEIQLKKPSQWDKKWRLIMFDIPHSFKKARDVFRRKLKDLKFYPIQKSVYITPYQCEDEIDFIASILDVRKYVLIMYISHFEGEEKLKYYFNI